MKYPEIVAEISANHKGSKNTAATLINECYLAGASAVKLQTWTDGEMVLDGRLVVPSDSPWAGLNMRALYAEAWLPWSWQQEFLTGTDITVFSSVFDLGALEFLERWGCPRYKIASFEITDLPLIEAVAKTKKPMIISTGMATEQEIKEAVSTAKLWGCTDLTLLKCTSAYPAEPASANLKAMVRLGSLFGCKFGLSDHTPGIGVALAAVALGAVMIEKHVTLSGTGGGLDSGFSIEINELAQLVTESRRAADAMGDASYGPTKEEVPQLYFRRSLVVTKDLKRGDRVQMDCLTTARPALGIPPNCLRNVLNKKTKQSIKAGTILQWNMLWSMFAK